METSPPSVKGLKNLGYAPTFRVFEQGGGIFVVPHLL
jgi:hypothetical protein